MKRSKVRELIANWAKPEILFDNFANDYQDWADNLLYVLENEIGMLPPKIKTLETYNDSESKQKCEYTSFRYNWEPEINIKSDQDDHSRTCRCGCNHE